MRLKRTGARKIEKIVDLLAWNAWLLGTRFNGKV